jgi:Tfp pilus assembly protein PilV
MKLSYLSAGLLSLATFSTLVTLSAPHASAQCVMNDINMQVSMNGSRKPTERTNDVTQGSTGNCVGNSVTTTNVQTNVGGTDRAVQRRQSTQQINGGDSSPTGINMDPVKVKTNAQVDVDNPAARLKR